jgi:hypothetical protein
MPRLPALPLALAACFALALAPATAHAGDPSRNLDEVETSEPRDVDDAATARSGDVDDSLAGEPADPDVVEAEDLDAAGTAEAEDVDQNLGSSKTFDEADQAPEWVPPACEALELGLGELPGGSDSAAWAATLGDAEAQIERSRTRLATADAEYTYARNRKSPRGDALKKIVTSRDAARSEYATARCRLPELVEKARRAGVSAEVWRAFPASLE